MTSSPNPLLNQLAKVYRVLGYEVMIEPDELEVPRLWIRKPEWEGYAYTVLTKERATTISPDLCAEIEQWLDSEERDYAWQLNSFNTVSGRRYSMQVWDGVNRLCICDRETANLARLAAFLEVFKGGE